MAWLVFRSAVNNPELALAGLRFDYAICEGAARTHLLAYVPGSVPWDEYEKGLLFGSDSELRFRRRPDRGFHLVLTTDLDPPPSGWEGPQQLRRLERRSRIVLWGEPDGRAGGWFEGRIPTELPYAFGTRQRGRVTITRQHYELVPAAAPARDAGEEPEIRRCVSMQFVKLRRLR